MIKNAATIKGFHQAGDQLSWWSTLSSKFRHRAIFSLSRRTGGQVFLSVTVSIGVSSLQKADTIASVTQRADQAFYAAKHNGKNRVYSGKT